MFRQVQHVESTKDQVEQKLSQGEGKIATQAQQLASTPEGTHVAKSYGKTADVSQFPAASHLLSDSDKKNINELADAVKAGNFSVADKIVRKYEHQAWHLLDLLEPMKKAFADRSLPNNGLGYLYSFSSDCGLMEMSKDGRSFHYMRTDGADQNTPRDR